MQRMRKQRVSALLVLGFMAATVLTAGPVQAANGNGPYYAEPAWSQKLPAATRFVVLTDWNSEAVLDRETGLVWERAPQADTDIWRDARFTCIAKTVGNRKGWRLPSIQELASLVDPSVPLPGPTLPAGHPFTNIQTEGYWSATTYTDFPEVASVVFFVTGDTGFIRGKTLRLQVWCVRGGNNPDAY